MAIMILIRFSRRPGATVDEIVAISINVDALNNEFVSDIGRQTGAVDIFPGTIGNQGPLVRGNELERVFFKRNARPRANAHHRIGLG